MKKIVILILIFLQGIESYAQEKLNKISTPSSPASSVLGIEPSTILAPKSYQALETALYSNFTDENGNGIIPNDFALEFTPYWTKDHKLSIEEYLYPKNNMSLIYRNSSLSLASTQSFQMGDSSLTNAIALGYRTTLYLGNEQDRSLTNFYKEALNNRQRIVVKFLSLVTDILRDVKIENKNDFFLAFKQPLIEILKKDYSLNERKAEKIFENLSSKSSSLPDFNEDDSDAFVDSLRGLFDEELESLGSKYSFENFEEYIKSRQGFSIDFAYATIGSFPSNDFESLTFPNHSVWITPSYRFKDNWSRLRIMGVLRYQWYNLEYYKQYFPESDIFKNNFDYGLAISGNFKKFSIQIEAVGRDSKSEIPAGINEDGKELYTKESKTDFQCVGSFNYNLTNQIILSYSIGNQFDPILNIDNKLVSQLTLNFGFGTPTKDENLK